MSPDMVLEGMSQELSLNEKVKLCGDPARVALGEELVEHLTQGIVVQADWDGERGLGGREPEQNNSPLRSCSSDRGPTPNRQLLVHVGTLSTIEQVQQDAPCTRSVACRL